MLRWVEAAVVVVVVEVVYHTTCVELLRHGHSSWTVLFFMNTSEDEDEVTWRSSVDDVATENANECDQQMTRMIPTTVAIIMANNHWRMGILAETIGNTMVVHFCGDVYPVRRSGVRDIILIILFRLSREWVRRERKWPIAS